MDVGEHTAARDGHAAEEFVELLIVAHSQLEVAGNDAGLLVVAGGVAGELEDLGAEVLQDCREVDRGPSTDTGGVLALLEEAADAADRELETRLGRPRGLLAAGLAAAAALALALARHVELVGGWLKEECDVVR